MNFTTFNAIEPTTLNSEPWKLTGTHYYTTGATEDYMFPENADRYYIKLTTTPVHSYAH